MPEFNINNAALSTLATSVTDYSVPTASVDGPTGTEKEYINTNWSKQWGYFTNVPDLKTAILLKAVWIVGKGYNCDSRTKVILEYIKGWGKDTFEDIIFNMEVIKRIGGDAYAEIIRGDDGTIINLKPLDPSNIKIVVDGYGIIKRYEQITNNKNVIQKWKPEDIFHLSHNRLANQISGISDIDAVEKTILADEENFDDIKKLMHRQARPLIIFKLKTDNATKISNFITKMDAAWNKEGECIYLPDDEDLLSYEVVQVNPSAAVFEWRNDIRNKFFRTIGLPQIVPGAGGQSTESESKVIYLAFEQMVAKDKRYLEKQIWNQLYLKLDFNSPATMQADLQADTGKDGQYQQLNFQPREVGLS